MESVEATINPVIINFAPTGMVPMKSDNSALPITPAEIIDDVHRAYEIGITVVHLHARDQDGKPTYKRETYQKIVEGVRKHCPDLVIGLSLSGRNFNELEKRSEALQLGVDMGSLTLSSLNFPRQASVNSPDMIQALCLKMKQTGTNPELEVFDLGMLNYANYLIKKNMISAPFYFNIILNNIAGMQVEANQIGAAISALPEGSSWSLGGIGKGQLPANMISLALGGGVRVGLEDNLYYDSGRSELATNERLIKRIHRMAEEIDRPIMKTSTFGNMGFYNKNRI